MSMFKGLGSALSASLLILPAVSNAQTAGGQPKKVFACSFGKKQVQVTAAGGNLLYSFGIPGKPEIVVVGNPKLGSVLYHYELYARGSTTQLKFRNGPYSYVVYSSFLAGRDGRETAGLVVFKGKARLSFMTCKDPGSDFGTALNLKTLPDDPDLITFGEHNEPELD